MGRSRRPIPKGLGEKLYFVRLRLRFTQRQMFERLQSVLDQDLAPITLYPSHISEYEREIREPPLRVLLEYARVAQVPLEILADRWLSFPNSFGLSVTADLLKKRKAEAALGKQDVGLKSVKKKTKVAVKRNSKR